MRHRFKLGSKVWLYLLLWTHGISQFFMWVDEGFYDFRWMSDPGNWLVYFIYTTFLVLVEWIVYALLPGGVHYRKWKITVSIILSFFLLTALLFGSFLIALETGRLMPVQD